MIATIEQNAVDRFRDFVARRLGLQFENGALDRLRDVLQERIQRSRCPSALSYLEWLEAPATGLEELAVLAAELTVGETFFLRHPDHFRAFAEVVLPERLRAQAARRRLRFLSAGCASGEEAYSLAMLLGAGLPDRAGWDLRVLGIDLNAAALKKAAEARYTPWSLRGVPEDIVRRHFRPVGRDYVLEDSVRELVSFGEKNLVAEDPGFWLPDEFDAIFCRNVTMYFTPEATHAVIARLTRSLVPGGFLVLGPAENLRGISQDYHLRHTHDTFYYQRRLPGEKPAPRTAGGGLASQPAEVELPEMVAADESWVEAICQSSDRIARLSQDLAPTLSPGRAADKGQGGIGTAFRDMSPRGLGAAHELVRQDRFEDALRVLQALPQEEGQDPDAQLLGAVILTNRGRVAEAEQLCRQVLAGDELNAEAHYLLALCREHAGAYGAAVEHDQMASYLDSQFAMPHLHLGLLAKKSGDRELACRAFRQAAMLLAREDAARILLFGGGFNREALIQLCLAEQRAGGGSP